MRLFGLVFILSLLTGCSTWIAPNPVIDSEKATVVTRPLSFEDGRYTVNISSINGNETFEYWFVNHFSPGTHEFHFSCESANGGLVSDRGVYELKKGQCYTPVYVTGSARGSTKVIKGAWEPAIKTSFDGCNVILRHSTSDWCEQRATW